MESDLRKLGIYPGDLPFIHSSFKSLGPVSGGVAMVVRALESVVGDGLVGTQQRGLVGASDCRLFDMAEFVDTLVAEARSDAAAYLRR